MKFTFVNHIIITLLFVILIPINEITFAQKINLNSDKYVALMYPRGKEIFTKGEEVEIQWAYRNVNMIKIELFDGIDTWKTIGDRINAAELNYKFKLNFSGTQFKLRISDANDSLVYDISPYFLEVVTFLSQNPSQNQNILQKTSDVNQLKIMPLGNSITEGRLDPRFPPYNGYRKKLREIMNINGLQFDFVGSRNNGDFDDTDHQGNPGWHAKHWFNNLNYDITSNLLQFLTEYPPDIILLHVGTNDIGEYYETTPADNDNSIDTTVADVSGLLDIIFSFDPNIDVILAKIINRADSLSDTTTAYNIALDLMANTRINNGDNLKLVDMENALTYPNDLSDLVHPTIGGYEKMAPIWFDGIKSILPKIKLKVFFEGNYIATGNMDLSLNNSGDIPTDQPFDQAPWNYAGNESISSIPSNVVDWVLVSLRTDTSKSSEICRRAGLILSDGNIIDVDGSDSLTFATESGSYYLVVEHRNHLPIMSASKVLIQP